MRAKGIADLNGAVESGVAVQFKVLAHHPIGARLVVVGPQQAARPDTQLSENRNEVMGILARDAEDHVVGRQSVV